MASEQAPVLKHHREEAARAVDPNSPAWLMQWVDSGAWREVHGAIASTLGRHFAEYCAQSLANAEAAVHARYAPLVSAARGSVENYDACTGWDKLNNEALREALKGLEE